MRTAKAFGLFVVTLVLASCLPVNSLNPFFTGADLVFDPGLLGTWESKDGDGMMVNGFLKFERLGEKGYRMTVTNPETQEQFHSELRLVRLAGRLYLDVLPEEPTARPGSYRVTAVSSGNTMSFDPPLLQIGDGVYLKRIPPLTGAREDSYEFRFIQAHWVFQARKEGGDLLRLGFLDDEWVEEMLSERKANIGFERVSEYQMDIVLTASTSELQQFVVQHAGERDAFLDLNELHRKK